MSDATSTPEVEKMEGTVHPEFEVQSTKEGTTRKEKKKEPKDPNVDWLGRPLVFAKKIIHMTDKKGRTKDIVVPMEVPADHLNRAQRRKLARSHVAEMRRERRRGK